MDRPQVKQNITITIDNIGVNGEGIGHWDGYTLFIDNALPGEVVKAKVTQCKKTYGRADLVEIITPSPDRIEPPCPLADRCGGCQLMHLAYSEQLAFKRQLIIDSLQRIGHISDIEVPECIASPQQLSYRNKIQLPIKTGKNGLTIGLYVRGTHNLVETDECFIHCEIGNRVLKKVQAIITGLHSNARNKSHLRHLMIKTAVNTEQVLVVIVTNGSNSKAMSNIANDIMKSCPEVKGVVQNINTYRDNIILGDRYDVLEGSGYISEKLCGMTFKLSPSSFFQINTAQAEQIYSKTLEFAELTGEETILDAYCGIGTLSLLMAKHAKKVIAVENVQEATKDAKENAKINEITNVDFTCSDAETFINIIDGDVDVAIVNPPRKGCVPSFLEGLGRLHPERIVYISCNPATLARDLAILARYDYNIEAIQPFDMFPQTAHVECIVKLTAIHREDD